MTSLRTSAQEANSLRTKTIFCCCCCCHAGWQAIYDGRLTYFLIHHSKLTLHFLLFFDKQVSNVQSPWIPHLLLDRPELPVVVATGIAC